MATGTVTLSSTSPSGFTTLDGPEISGTIGTVYLIGKVLTSGEAAAGTVTVNFTGAGRLIVTGLVFYNVDLTAFVAATAIVNGSSTSTSLPSLTTAQANAEVVALVTTRLGSGTPSSITFPGGWTKVVDAKQASGAANMSASLAYLTTPGAAGSYGGGTANLSPAVSSNPVMALMIAFNPVASGFSGSATMSGTGTLTAGGTPAASDVASLSGSGTLSASGAPAPTSSASLSGTGSLVASGAPAVPGSAALSGSGSLVASGVPRPVQSAALSGTGSLVAGGTPAIGQAASLSGTGTLVASGSGSSSGSGSAVLSGSGTLVATGTPGPSQVVALSGSGTLVPTGKPGPVQTVGLSGLGTLTVVGLPVLAGMALLDGVGTLASLHNDPLYFVWDGEVEWPVSVAEVLVGSRVRFG
jgi:hypothetical protein